MKKCFNYYGVCFTADRMFRWTFQMLRKKLQKQKSENKVEALKSSAEIREELKDVALPFIDNGEYGLMNIDGKKVFVTDEDQIKTTFDDKYYIAGSEIRNIDGTPVVNPG